jgi:patatin-like phospholipase/acyl hydrolase
MRGLVICRIIQNLEAKHPGFLDSIDCFAGTSTGSIIAALLAVSKFNSLLYT